ncbi:MAG: DUF1543 domain-containing protein [Cyanobium sp.]
MPAADSTLLSSSSSSSSGSAPEDPRLFLVVLGGRTASSHIELHDVRFVVGHTIDDTLTELRHQWFGRREGLHLDAFLAVQAVDGWTVRLGREPSAPRPERLWFVNLGAYRPDSLAELHHFGLVVARSAPAAKAAARRQWLNGALQLHKDDLWAVDDCLALEQLELLGGERWHVQLEPHPQGFSQPQVPDWFGYRPI